MKNKKEKANSKIIIYNSADGQAKLDVTLDGETVWLTQRQMAELFDCTVENVIFHLKNAFESGELSEKATTKDSLVVQQEGSRTVKRPVKIYNLDAIISIGYKVNSIRGAQFRIWATERLKEYIVKGFTVDDERLKQGGGRARYFAELLQRIRDIRSSERNFYQKVTDIYATSIDYKKDDGLTKKFFATVQNKMHYAVHGQTAAEIKKLNLIVSLFFDFAELQAIEEVPMKMIDWIKKLDEFLKASDKKILNDTGKISHERAMEKANNEFVKYRKEQGKNYISDFDREMKKLLPEKDKNKK